MENSPPRLRRIFATLQLLQQSPRLRFVDELHVLVAEQHPDDQAAIAPCAFYQRLIWERSASVHLEPDLSVLHVDGEGVGSPLGQGGLVLVGFRARVVDALLRGAGSEGAERLGVGTAVSEDVDRSARDRICSPQTDIRRYLLYCERIESRRAHNGFDTFGGRSSGVVGRAQRVPRFSGRYDRR